MEIGQYNDLIVKSKTMIGIYLTDGKDDVLLPKKYIDQMPEEGDEMRVFVYLDNDNRPIATTLEPTAQVGDYAFLQVKEVNQHGAFLDWGIAKDLFVPYAEQRNEMKEGRRYIVYVLIDDESGRIAATSKWSKHISKDHNLKEDDEVGLLIAERTDMGMRAIINNNNEGLIYANEIFGDLEIGDKRRGYIKLVREDGKIDLRLTPKGYEHVEDSKFVILNHLKNNQGILKLGDKSPAEEIYSELKMSKKIFKKTIGGLYRDRLINLGDFEISLIQGE